MFILHFNHDTEHIKIPNWKSYAKKIFDSFLNFLKSNPSPQKTQCTIILQSKNPNTIQSKYFNSICLKILWTCLIEKNCISLSQMNHVAIIQNTDQFNHWEHFNFKFNLFNEINLDKKKFKTIDSKDFILCWKVSNYHTEKINPLYNILSKSESNVFLIKDCILENTMIGNCYDKMKINPMKLNYFYDFDFENEIKSEQWLSFENFNVNKVNSKEQTSQSQNDWSFLDQKTGIVFMDSKDHVSNHINQNQKNKWSLEFYHLNWMDQSTESKYVDYLISQTKMSSSMHSFLQNIAQNLYSSFVKYSTSHHQHCDSFLFCNSF